MDQRQDKDPLDQEKKVRHRPLTLLLPLPLPLPPLRKGRNLAGHGLVKYSPPPPLGSAPADSSKQVGRYSIQREGRKEGAGKEEEELFLLSDNKLTRFTHSAHAPQPQSAVRSLTV